MAYWKNNLLCSEEAYYLDRTERLYPSDVAVNGLYMVRFMYYEGLAANLPVRLLGKEQADHRDYRYIHLDWLNDDLQHTHDFWMPMHDDGILQAVSEPSMHRFEGYLRDYDHDEVGQTIQAINAIHRLGQILIDPNKYQQ